MSLTGIWVGWLGRRVPAAGTGGGRRWSADGLAVDVWRSGRGSRRPSADLALTVGPVRLERDVELLVGATPPATTSTTTTVMLSRPPWRLAVATSCSAACWGSSMPPSSVGDRRRRHLVDQPVGAEQEAVAAVTAAASTRRRDRAARCRGRG